MDRIREATKAPNIDKLYEKLFSIKEMLTEVMQTAQEAANDAGNFGGDISAVIPNQLRSQFVVGIQNFISQPGNPVAIDSMITYLDSLPLSKVRVPRGEEAMMQQGMMNSAVGAAPGMPGSSAVTGLATPGGSSIPPAPGSGIQESIQENGEEFVCYNCDTTGNIDELDEVEGELCCPTCQSSDIDIRNIASETVRESLQSAILRAKGQPLLDEARKMWEEEHVEGPIVEGSLDFRAIKEGYQRKPSTPEVFTRNDEEKVYKRTLESVDKKASKLQEADMLISPYAKREVESMDGWRDLVESHVNDEEISERLGAGAVASAILSESTESTTSTGIQRMKELVSPPEPAADAGDVAVLAMKGLIKEEAVSDFKRIQENADGGDDLVALVQADSRELV